MIAASGALALYRFNRRLAQTRRSASIPDKAAGPPGLRIHRDPAAAGPLDWSSPRARLLEMEVAEGAGGRYLGLHLALPLRRIGGRMRIGIALHGAAAPAITLRPCLRSALKGGGFVDSFFPMPLRLPAAGGDLFALFDPALGQRLPEVAAWRELILFLPPDGGFCLSLHSLSVIAA